MHTKTLLTRAQETRTEPMPSLVLARSIATHGGSVSWPTPNHAYHLENIKPCMVAHADQFVH